MSVVEEFAKNRRERLIRLGGVATSVPPTVATDVIAVTEPTKLTAGPQSARRIQLIVARHFGIEVSDMESSRRLLKFSFPRMVAVYLVKEFTAKSLPEIGRYFGGRDHTTILHSIRKIGERILSDPITSEEVNALRRQIMDDDWVDPVLQAAVEQAARNAWMDAKEIEGYRRHAGARKFLKSKSCLDEIEMARDYLSRILDDMRGVGQ